MINKMKNAAIVSCLIAAATVVNANGDATLNKTIVQADSNTLIPMFLKKNVLKSNAPKYVDDFDISGDGDVEEMKDFNGAENLYFGTVSRIEDSIGYRTEDKMTYKSGWTPEVIKRPFNAKRFDTYVFSRYVNLP